MSEQEYIKQMNLETETVERIARKIVTNLSVPEFGIGGVPTDVAAEVLGKSAMYVREGIEKGWLPIGHAERTGQRCNVYISPKLLWEYTGYVWKGKTA